MLSLDAVVASQRPSGLKATVPTQLSWPARMRGAAAGSVTFHRRAVLSPDAVASQRPSRLKDTDQTSALWPARMRGDVAGSVTFHKRPPGAAGAFDGCGGIPFSLRRLGPAVEILVQWHGAHHLDL